MTKVEFAMWFGRRILGFGRLLIGGMFVPAALALLSAILPAGCWLGGDKAFRVLAVTTCLCVFGATACSAATIPLQNWLRRKR